MPVSNLAILVKMSGGLLPPNSRAGDVEIYDNGRMLIFESDTDIVERQIDRQKVVEVLQYAREVGFFQLPNIVHDSGASPNVPDVTLSIVDAMGNNTVTMTSYQRLKGEMRKSPFDLIYKRITDLAWESYTTGSAPTPEAAPVAPPAAQPAAPSRQQPMPPQQMQNPMMPQNQPPAQMPRQPEPAIPQAQIPPLPFSNQGQQQQNAQQNAGFELPSLDDLLKSSGLQFDAPTDASKAPGLPPLNAPQMPTGDMAGKIPTLPPLNQAPSSRPPQAPPLQSVFNQPAPGPQLPPMPNLQQPAAPQQRPPQPPKQPAAPQQQPNQQQPMTQQNRAEPPMPPQPKPQPQQQPRQEQPKQQVANQPASKKEQRAPAAPQPPKQPAAPQQQPKQQQEARQPQQQQPPRPPAEPKPRVEQPRPQPVEQAPEIQELPVQAERPPRPERENRQPEQRSEERAARQEERAPEREQRNPEPKSERTQQQPQRAVQPVLPPQRKPPVAWERTQESIERLEESLHGKVLVYYAANTWVSMEDMRYLYSHLRKLGRKKSLYLLPIIMDADSTVIWRMATLIREFCDELHVILPEESSVATTIMALAGDSILMNPFGFLSPIDTRFSHKLLSKSFDQEYVSVPLNEIFQASGVSVAKSSTRQKVADAQPAQQNDSDTFHPLVTAAATRQLSLIQRICTNLLKLRKNAPTDAQIAQIVQTLTQGYPSSDYPIVYFEAKNLGLPVSETSEAVNDVLWDLIKEYSYLTEPVINFQNNYRMFESQNLLIESTGRRTVHYTERMDKDEENTESDKHQRPVEMHSRWRELTQQISINPAGKESHQLIWKELQLLGSNE